MARKKRLTKTEKQLIQAQCDIANLNDRINSKEASLQRALTERDSAKREVQLTEQRLEDEQARSRAMLSDLRDLHVMLVCYGQEKPDAPKFDVSLERHYGRVEGRIKEMVKSHEQFSSNHHDLRPPRQLPF